MSEMVERAAEAAWNASPRIIIAPGHSGPVAWADAHEWERKLCRVHARAAIEAMREPVGLTDAGVDKFYNWNPIEDEATLIVWSVWEGMITAALSPQETDMREVG